MILTDEEIDHVVAGNLEEHGNLADYRAVEAAVIAKIKERYDELHQAARKVLRYNGVDATRFTIALQQMDLVIQRHLQEIELK